MPQHRLTVTMPPETYDPVATFHNATRLAGHTVSMAAVARASLRLFNELRIDPTGITTEDELLQALRRACQRSGSG